VLDVEVISDPAAAVTALDPVRTRLLSELGEPASAATLATRTGITRQKVNYHLRALEHRGLVVAAGERKWGGLTERLMVASASSYVVSPQALGPVGADPARSGDRLSASYLVALAARTIREVGELWRRSRDADKRLATLSIDTAVRCAAPSASDLTDAVTSVVARYHDETAPRGRTHRLVVAAYPAPATD
jgi:DNA-binding transcriptional ArsR family regulator